MMGSLDLHKELNWAYAATWYQQDKHWQGFISKTTDQEAKSWFEMGKQPLDFSCEDNQCQVSIPDTWI
jgi:hypothetical protein